MPIFSTNVASSGNSIARVRAYDNNLTGGTRKR